MKRQPFPVPYGLFIVLGVYAASVLVYVWRTYWNSAEYLAAEHFAAASELLGRDDGRSATEGVLMDAYRHYLEAARLVPREKQLHERVEAMRWRLDERHATLPMDLKMRGEAVALLWVRMQAEQEPIFVVGARDRGWTPQQLLDGPGRAFLHSLPGALVIVLVWAWLKFSGRRVREKEHEAGLQQIEADLHALDGQRATGERSARRPPPAGSAKRGKTR